MSKTKIIHSLFVAAAVATVGAGCRHDDNGSDRIERSLLTPNQDQLKALAQADARPDVAVAPLNAP